MPPPLSRSGVRLAEVEEVELTIEKLVDGGDGLGRFEGIPLFIARSAPGDRLRVRLVERHPDYGRAEIVEILSPGERRREAPCPHFARCGGCDLQHIEDDAQVRFKAEAVLETLARIAGIKAAPTALRIVRGDPWAYRLRAQLHVDQAAGATRVGYHARGSNALVPVGVCPVLFQPLEDLVKALPAALPAGAPSRIDLAAGEDGNLSVSPLVEGLPRGEVAFHAGGFAYSFDARCFFQAHRGLLDELLEVAVGEERGETAFDLFSGVGLFTLPLAARYTNVVGVESEASAVRFARTNARRNRVTNAEFVQKGVEAWIRELPPGVDRVLADPPRGGLSTVVRRIILDRRPRRLTYVSCHAAALARDLRDLLQGYTLTSLALVDLFPQTGHMESIVQLEAK